MAGVAYYNTGTATVAVNSKTVTGTGTNWLSVVGGLTAIKAGDKFGIHVGRPIIIASVDSNTQLTLEDNWPGPAQTNAAYRIELTNPDVIAVEALRRVLGSLSGGILFGVSQLTAAPNKALTIDENGAAALADLSPLGKSLIAALNSSAAYGALGVIPNAQLPTRLRDLSTAVTDANTAITNGVYGVASNAANIPVAATGSITVATFNATNLVQIYTRVSNGDVWVRSLAGGAWGSWSRLIASDSAGVVSDTALPARLRELSPTIADADTVLASGNYAVASGASGIPEASAGMLSVGMYSTNSGAVQIYVRASNGNVWRRARNSGSWGSWKRIDGDLSGPGATVVANAFVGFSGTSGFLTKALTTLEALASLGPVFGGTIPTPSTAGVGLSDGDFNTLTVGGVYTTTGSYANGPLGNPATHAGYVEIYPRYSTHVTQIFRTTPGVAYKRVGNRASASVDWTWGAWGITEGDVTGPASSVNNRLAAFGGTGGKTLADSGVLISDIVKTSDVPARIASALLQDQKATGVSGGTSVVGWQTRTLNTEVFDPNNLVTLASNQFTVAFDCDCEYITNAYHPTGTGLKGRIYNVTDSAVVAYSGVGYVQANSYNVVGYARLVAGKTYRLDMYAAVAAATNGLGGYVGDGSTEIYSSVYLRRV
ncbi:hypothetical protein SAMN05216358_3716 [Rhizobium sp. AN5]|uniref:pyocin knob domain-containing protein n=1 Tax=Rhizobium sp. AN5 TaxID=1855304 RepID=UPI000BC7F74A|nr:pyocin knob domain-containing protein [Rhizobium sp. AN5]SOC93537.1 hypothetical protein SAMN05216358_3716 [Rhizobium sp. AN5]